MPYAVIFPGQGAASPGSGEPWLEHPAWQGVEQAEAILGRPLGRLLLEADADELATTRSSQMAVLLASLLAWDLLSELVDEPPIAFAGHSLGQITALLASGAVSRDDGLRLTERRADETQRSAETRPGRMAALFGANLPTADQVCAGIEAWVANDNAPGQVVIAGTPEGMDQAIGRAEEHKIRVRPLAVGHAFHTPLLADAADRLRPLLDTLPFREPTAPVVANTDAASHTDPGGWPDRLTRHLVEPVRWQDCQHALTSLGADTLVEPGPGRVLAGLARRTVPEVRVLNASTPDEITAAARQLVDALTAAPPAPAGARPSRSSPTPPEATA